MKIQLIVNTGLQTLVTNHYTLTNDFDLLVRYLVETYGRSNVKLQRVREL